MKSTRITHPQVLEAVRVLSTLGASMPSQSQFPPFSYGPNPPAFPMTPGNSLPAMAVWLFLVTDPGFLYALDNVPNATPLSVEDIAAATNLTTDTVNAILDQYRNRDQSDTNHFLRVAQSFQDFADLAGYTKTNCPGGAEHILQLADSGAAVDPNSQ